MKIFGANSDTGLRKLTGIHGKGCHYAAEEETINLG